MYDALFRDTKERIVAPPAFPEGARFADTHAHLDMLHNPELALARCAAHGVDYVVTIIDPTEDPRYTLENLSNWCTQAQELAHSFSLTSNAAVPCVRIIAGCHPHNASRYTEAVEQTLRATLKDSRSRGVGEIGLDYHYDVSPRTVQQDVFRRQLMLAHELKLPVVLHLREAHEDGLRILQDIGTPSAGTLLHCFNLDYATLEPFLELGCSVAFGGPLTFKKSDEVRAAAAHTPLERIVTETDAPFMAPHPLRGVSCGPEHVVFTAACLADILHDAHSALSLSEIYAQLYSNACSVFEPHQDGE
jgi:TatD DNase family protein